MYTLRCHAKTGTTISRYIMNENDQGQMLLSWIKCILMMSNRLKGHVKRSLNPDLGGWGLILLSRHNKDTRDKKKNCLYSSSSFAPVFQHVFPTTYAPYAFCQWQQPQLLSVTWLKCAFLFSFTQPAMTLLLCTTTCVYFLITSTGFTSAVLPTDSTIYG